MRFVYAFAFFFGISIAVANGQSNTPSKDVNKDVAPAQSSDRVVPTPEPAHIIGDDGQKVYFLVNPKAPAQDAAIKKDEPNQRSISQPARKPE